MKQKDEVTIDDLKSLFGQDNENDISLDNSESGHGTEINKLFWNALVSYNNREVNRAEAVSHIERLYSWECKQKGRSIVDEPTIKLFGRETCVKVADNLMSLVAVSEEDEIVVNELVKLKELVTEMSKSEFYVTNMVQ